MPPVLGQLVESVTKIQKRTCCWWSQDRVEGLMSAWSLTLTSLKEELTLAWRTVNKGGGIKYEPAIS
jgi:hypothetical protein